MPTSVNPLKKNSSCWDEVGIERIDRMMKRVMRFGIFLVSIFWGVGGFEEWGNLGWWWLLWVGWY